MKITKATRWRVFAGVWIQSLFTSATAFFSLFALPLTGQFGWSSSEFSMAYTIYMFVYCAMGFVGGLLAEKLQPRVAIYLGLLFFSAGWFLTGFASSIPQLYLFYGVMAGAGAGTIYPACLPTALKWFPDKAGSISGLVQAGASCGPFIMSPIAQWLIDTYGAQMACRILAVVFLIGVGAVAWMTRSAASITGTTRAGTGRTPRTTTSPRWSRPLCSGSCWSCSSLRTLPAR